MQTQTTETKTEPTKLETLLGAMAIIWVALFSCSIFALACYFPCKWAFPDNYLTVSQWFMVVVITKLLKVV